MQNNILFALFIAFFKIGAVTFGGGYAMIPMITEVVVRNGWMSETALIDFIAVSESTPGPFAVNAATFIGNAQAGIVGGLAATLGVLLPTFLIVSVLARFFLGFAGNKYVKGAVSGIYPIVIGMISAAVVTLSLAAFFPLWKLTHSIPLTLAGANPVPIAVFVLLVIFSRFKKLEPIPMLVISSVLGIVFCTVAGMLGIAV